jgi:probable F420-dependent oxidoreductase
VQLGVCLPNPTIQEEHDHFLPAARAADRLGFDSLFVNDHVLRLWDIRFLDPLTAVAVAAGATERIRLGTSVLVVPYRHPVILAHAVASIDVLSGGRFVLGIGAGWADEEFALLGVPRAERGARTDESLEIMRSLWQDGPASFSGRHFAFAEALLGVSPRTPGGPPIWVGGYSPAALRRALRFGQAWHGTNASPDEVARVRQGLDEVAEESGRDPATLGLTTTSMLVPPDLEGTPPEGAILLGGSADEIVENLGRLGKAGVSTSLLWPRVPPEHAVEALEWIAAEVLPQAEDL